jgi:2-polyprenyl-3-methyl-5-hydroxy-6-metoxy-1,4-benzoquinol methylase
MENEELAQCLICRCRALLKCNEFPGYQEPATFKIYHCQNCKTAFSLPVTETGKLYEIIYKNGENVPGYDRYWKYARDVKTASNPLKYLAEREETYWSVNEALILCINDKNSARILEIGSGLGYLVFALIRAEYDAVGLDTSQTAVNFAKENYGNHYLCTNLLEYSRNNPESFDIVILAEVLEHVDNPLNFIKLILSLLKPNGKIIITTPNKSFYKEAIWASDSPPVHFWWFSEESMNHIAEAVNMSIRFISFKNYYKGHFTLADLRTLRNGKIPKPVLDRSGNLTAPAKSPNKTIKDIILSLMNTVSIMKLVKMKIRKLLDNNIIVCEDKGEVLSVIFQRK